MYHADIKRAISSKYSSKGDTERHTHRGRPTISLGSLSCIYCDSSFSFIPSFLTCQISRLSLHFSSSPTLLSCFASAFLGSCLKCILTLPIGRSKATDHSKPSFRSVSIPAPFLSFACLIPSGIFSVTSCTYPSFFPNYLNCRFPPERQDIASHKKTVLRLQVQMGVYGSGQTASNREQ